MNLVSPVAIAANTTYIVAYWANTGFAYDAGALTNSRRRHPPLHALRAGVDGPNAVYANGSSPVFPTTDGMGNHYWADVVFFPASSLSPTPDLTVAKQHTGNFTQGQTGATYTITVSNSGTGPTTGTVTLTETVPGGLTATSMLGNGWSCTQPAGPCTRTDALAAGSSYPPITLTANVSGTAAFVVTNTVAVSGGGETNTSNDQASDPTMVQASGPTESVTIWSSASTPQHPLFNSAAVTLGVKFRSDVSGTVSGIRFYKGAGNNGTHTGCSITPAARCWHRHVYG